MFASLVHSHQMVSGFFSGGNGCRLSGSGGQSFSATYATGQQGGEFLDLILPSCKMRW